MTGAPTKINPRVTCDIAHANLPSPLFCKEGESMKRGKLKTGCKDSPFERGILQAPRE
jgi:hypothetical protein